MWRPGVGGGRPHNSIILTRKRCAGLGKAGGRELLALIDRRERASTNVSLGRFGSISASALGLPIFTLAMGLLDGFNPCAMWVLLFLLSLLVHWRDRRRMALVAGTFVFVSGAFRYQCRRRNRDWRCDDKQPELPAQRSTRRARATASRDRAERERSPGWRSCNRHSRCAWNTGAAPPVVP